MNRSTWTGAVVALLLGAALVVVLSRGRGGNEGPAELVPGDARAYLQLDDHVRAVEHLEGLIERIGLGIFSGGAHKGVTRQLGFDPADPEALRERGLDPSRPAAGYLPADSEDLVVLLPVKDGAKLEATLAELWGERTGGSVEAVEEEGVRYQKALLANGEVGAAWAREGGYQILSPGKGAPDRLFQVLAPGGAPRLTQQPTFSAAFEALAPGSHLFLWGLPEGVARADRRLKGMEEGLDAGALALTLTRDSAEVALLGDLGAVAATALPIFAPADSGRIEGLFSRLLPEAVLAARFSLSFPEVWKRAAQLRSLNALEGLEAQLRARGVEVSEVLPLFDGQIVGGLTPLAEAELDRMPSLDLRRTNPFAYVRAEVRAGLKDPKKVRELLPLAAEALAPALRADVVRGEIEGSEAFTIKYHLGEGMTFGVIGDDLVATGGEGAFAAALRRHAGKTEGYGANLKQAPYAARLTREGSFGAVLQVDRLLTALGEVDSERLGGGPTGMTAALAFRKMRATLEKFDHLSLGVLPGKSEVVTRLQVNLEPLPASESGGAPQP
ncbi:MAG: hypothetical protein P1V51_17190 [Deltaproteobacteria bacterium]|nr:hypothetical protein [Deltaproteobacteria bacterium]